MKDIKVLAIYTLVMPILIFAITQLETRWIVAGLAICLLLGMGYSLATVAKWSDEAADRYQAQGSDGEGI